MVWTHQSHHSVTVRWHEGETGERAYVKWGEYDHSIHTPLQWYHFYTKCTGLFFKLVNSFYCQRMSLPLCFFPPCVSPTSSRTHQKGRGEEKAAGSLRWLRRETTRFSHYSSVLSKLCQWMPVNTVPFLMWQVGVPCCWAHWVLCCGSSPQILVPEAAVSADSSHSRSLTAVTEVSESLNPLPSAGCICLARRPLAHKSHKDGRRSLKHFSWSLTKLSKANISIELCFNTFDKRNRLFENCWQWGMY